MQGKNLEIRRFGKCKGLIKDLIGNINTNITTKDIWFYKSMQWMGVMCATIHTVEGLVYVSTSKGEW